MTGDLIELKNDTWTIKSRVYYPEYDVLKIYLTQSVSKQMNAESVDAGRLNKMHNAILAVNKRQDAVEKKSLSLTEHIISLREAVKKQSTKERKDNDKA